MRGRVMGDGEQENRCVDWESGEGGPGTALRHPKADEEGSNAN